MKRFQCLGTVALACALLAACGGGGDVSERAQPAANGNAAHAAPAFSSLVVIGDSLSDVGSYRTPGIATIGGGQYTVNGAGSANWTELLARELAVAAPCAAQTGLEASGPLAGLAAPIENHAGCFSYAQGGARVTDPIGPSNKALLPQDPTGYLGQLTDPLAHQIARHLNASGGQFGGGELVAVLAGGNDLFVQLAILSATTGAGGDPNAAAAAAVGAMARAGAELAAYISQGMLGKGARHVVIVNLPDVGRSPFALGQSPQTRALITMMVQAFNT